MQIKELKNKFDKQEKVIEVGRKTIKIASVILALGALAYKFLLKKDSEDLDNDDLDNNDI